SYPGVSYATPISNADGSLRGVLGIGFNAYALCDFLKAVDEQVIGYAFLVEQRANGERRLIAHPDRTAILHEDTREGQALHAELRELKDVPDPRVVAMVENIPPSLDPKEQRELVLRR